MTEAAAWFLYSIVIANLLGLAAVAGESALRDGGKAGRWAWVGAMAASVTLPLLAWLGLSLRSVPVVPESALIPLAPLAPLAVSAGAGPVASGPSLDQVLLVAWAVVSVVLLAYMGLSWAAIVRDRRSWRTTSVGGVRVALTPDTGPAAWGVRRPEILLPEWAIELESRVRRLMLLHEGEHVRAGDTRVVLAGLLLLAVAPWNLPLWWQFRRLRQAIELDCDARVLRRAPDARRYGTLLLEVGRRRSVSVMVVAMADPPTFLERRIRLITAKARSPSLRRVAGLVLIASSLVAVAVCTRDPMAAEGDPLEMLASETAAAPAFTPFTLPPRLQNVEEIQRLLEREYPAELRDAGIGGSVDMWYYLDEDGTILKLQVREGSGYPALDRAAVGIASAMRFSPALNRDVPVKVWVSLPVTFRPAAPETGQIGLDQPEREALADDAIESGGDAAAAGSASAGLSIAEEEVDHGTAATGRLAGGPSAGAGAIDADDRAARMRQVPDGSPEAALPETSVLALPPRTVSASPPAVESGVERVADAVSPAAQTGEPPADGERPSITPFTTQPELLNLGEIQTLIEQEYPPLLRDAGIGGRAMVWLLITDEGDIARTRLAEGTGHPALDEAALRVASRMRFSPALNEGEAMSVWVSLPIGFVSR